MKHSNHRACSQIKGCEKLFEGQCVCVSVCVCMGFVYMFAGVYVYMCAGL